MKQVFFVVCLLSIGASSYAQPKKGSMAPDISLPGVSGDIIKLSSLRGKVVLLDFWASWCRPCRMSIKENQPIYDAYSSKGFEVLGVSIDGNKEAWKSALSQDESKWLQVIDVSAEYGNALTKTWNIQMIPSTFLIDKEGKIVAFDLSPNELEKLLKKLL